MTAYKTIEIGLPFFDDINHQIRNKPYYNSDIKEWICSDDKYPAFQFSISPNAVATTMATFDLVNVDTGVTTDLTAYFTANVAVIDRDVHGYYFTHLGNIASSLTDGRYYFHAITDADGYERFSEIFRVRSLRITANANPEFREIEIGLPFFDNINKQIRNKPYYNSSIKQWLSAFNRFPDFQISISEASIPTMSVFSLINVDTGVVSDQLVYFNANVINIDRDVLGYYWTHMGLTDVTVDEGRYYFYAKNADDIEWWSEVFVMCGNITKSIDYLLLDETDYLLIGGTDRLIIG